ncbi:MAG: folate-binding protein YgfZ [Nocardioidaceae bacterium]|nr:folate-binding protein YgfZ [Nocardioidaceae bacterium]
MSPLLDLPGAVDGDGIDAGVAWHYGNPVAEQRRLESGDGWVDVSHRDVVTMSGPDRLTLLHVMSTQHVERLAAGTWTEGLILSPHGHVEHHFAGVDDGETLTVHTEPGAGTGLVDFLTSMRFMMRVELAVVTDQVAVVAPGGTVAFLSRSTLPELPDRWGPPAGTWAHEALRIATGRPRIGIDTDHRTIPNEVGWIGTAVHMDKGCYRGQETVARVHTLGRPPRRLALLHLDGSAERLPAVGADLLLDGRTVGRVGSSARHHELGPIALGLVKRSVAVDAELLADGVAAAQEVLVDPAVGLHVRARL